MTSSAAPKTRLLRMEEVAEDYGFSIETLRYWRKTGVGPKSTRMGRRVVYREADVEAWIAAQFNASA